jgi:hypothetical protein
VSGFGSLRGVDLIPSVSGGGEDCHAFTDNFNRVRLGSDWIVSIGSTGLIDILGNKARMFGRTGNFMVMSRPVQFTSKATKTTVSVKITMPDRDQSQRLMDKVGLFIMGDSIPASFNHLNSYLFYLDNFRDSFTSNINGHVNTKVAGSLIVTRDSVFAWDVKAEAALKVEITRSTFEVFLDNVSIRTVVNSVRNNGVIGLMAQPAVEGYFLFDDFEITC